MCSQRETLICAVREPCTTGGVVDKQKRKGKILCTKTKRKRKPALLPEAMNGYRKEVV